MTTASFIIASTSVLVHQSLRLWRQSSIGASTARFWCSKTSIGPRLDPSSQLTIQFVHHAEIDQPVAKPPGGDGSGCGEGDRFMPEV